VNQAKSGDWVEIHRIVLEAENRAPQVPEDTKSVPLEMRIRGFALTEGTVGNLIRIRTLNGRQFEGRLTVVRPSYQHGYGAPIPELITIGGELRALLRGEPS
jgi:2-amino-4-ketopentanoate thiolase alpha subunit